MASYSAKSYSTKSYSPKYWDILVTVIATGWKEYKRLQVSITQMVSFKVFR